MSEHTVVARLPRIPRTPNFVLSSSEQPILIAIPVLFIFLSLTLHTSLAVTAAHISLFDSSTCFVPGYIPFFVLCPLL